MAYERREEAHGHRRVFATRVFPLLRSAVNQSPLSSHPNVKTDPAIFSHF